MFNGVMGVVFLEAADVARRIRRASATVRLLAITGRLPVAATTPRGARLFRVEDVEQYLRERDVDGKEVGVDSSGASSTTTEGSFRGRAVEVR